MTDKTDIKQMQMQMTILFPLSDVIVGTSVMRGYAGGSPSQRVMGIVRRILPGICFEVSVGDGTALLWRFYELVKNPDEDASMGQPDRPEDRKGMLAVVDCDFWASQGIDPLFLATEHDCFPDALPRSPTDLQEKLETWHELAVLRGSNSEAAWNRQRARLTTLLVNPMNQEDDEESEEEEEDEEDHEEEEEEEEEDDEEEEESEEEGEESEEEEEEAYTPVRAPQNLGELVAGFQEFLDTENIMIISNKTFIAIGVIIIAMFALFLMARNK